MIGIAALFHLPFALLPGLHLATVSVLRPFAWREFVVPRSGVSHPLVTGALLHLLGMPLRTSSSGLSSATMCPRPGRAAISHARQLRLGGPGGRWWPGLSMPSGRVVRGRPDGALLAHVASWS